MDQFTDIQSRGAIECEFGQAVTQPEIDETAIVGQMIRRLAVGMAGEREALERVLGVDERARIHETELLPWRMVCALTIRSGNSSYVGSGVLIGPQTVLTAGHNLYASREYGGWADTVDVSPGRDGPDLPFRTQRAVYFSALQRWVDLEDQEADLGVVHLSERFDPHPGHFGVAALSDDDLTGRTINVAGYPFQLEVRRPDGRMVTPQGRYLYHHRDLIQAVTDSRIFYSVDTSGGNSGSPAWIHETDCGPPVLIGIHGYGYSTNEQGPGIISNSAARVTPARLSIIKRWIEISESGGSV